LRRLTSSGLSSRRSSYYEVERKCRVLPRAVRQPLAMWWDRVSMVLEPEWFRTTILVWAAWFSMSLGMSIALEGGNSLCADDTPGCSIHDV
jgi:hypothetical protein